MTSTIETRPQLGHGEIAPSVKASDFPLLTLDLSNDVSRQTVIAAGSETVYQGHPTTLLLPDERTMYCVWTYGHGGACGPLKRSDDGGLTWSELLEVPASWSEVQNCPVLFRLPDSEGRFRLFVYAGQGADGCIHESHSDDDGRTWSAMRSLGIEAVMPFCTIIPIEEGRVLLGLSNIRRQGDEEEWTNRIAQSRSTDGGLSWTPWEIIVDDPAYRFCEPWLVPSPDGSEWTCLIRENLYGRSWRVTTRDEGRTWSAPERLPVGLSGDRHIARYAADGRLVVVFRDRAEQSGTTYHFLAWVGTYDDLFRGEGQYRIKLLHSHAGADCGYPGLEFLPDGTFVATTYIKYRAGSDRHSVVATRFTLAETDAMLAGVAVA